jgi:4-amino-4-deoxy-L-arabinose transferase-like glycosyltransferase
VAALALMLLAAAVGFHRLAAQPLWTDEAFSFFVAWRDLGHTLHFMRQDTQPPLYYLLLTFLLRLGHDPFVLRSLSALAFVLCVPLLLDAGTRLVGRQAALLGTLLFVLDPSVLIWAQRARPYALQTLFVALAFWGFARIWREGAGAGWRAWAGWIAGGGLAMLTQYPAGFFLLGAHVAVAVRWLRAPAAERGLLWRWIVAQVAMALPWLPWLPAFLGQAAHHLTAAGIEARHPVFLISGSRLWTELRGLLSVATLWRAQWPFLALFAALAVAGTVALWRRRAALPVLATSAVPLAVCLALYALVHPVFGYVTIDFVWLLLPYSLLVAAGALALPRPAAAAAVALLLLGDLWGLRNAYAIESVPLDRIGATIAAELAPGDGLLLSRDASGRFGLAYYLGPPYAGRIRGLDVSDAPAEGWPIRDAAGLDGVTRLWVVLPEGEAPAIAPADLAGRYRLALRRKFGTFLVERYDLAAGPPPSR